LTTTAWQPALQSAMPSRRQSVVLAMGSSLSCRFDRLVFRQGEDWHSGGLAARDPQQRSRIKPEGTRKLRHVILPVTHNGIVTGVAGQEAVCVASASPAEGREARRRHPLECDIMLCVWIGVCASVVPLKSARSRKCSGSLFKLPGRCRSLPGGIRKSFCVDETGGLRLLCVPIRRLLDRWSDSHARSFRKAKLEVRKKIDEAPVQ
jgi:hypothetical protein